MAKEVKKSKSEIVVHNEFNEVSMRQWTPKEMDLFIAIVSKVMNKKQDVVTLDTEELRTIISEKKNLDRWKETVVSVINKIGELKYHSYTDKAYSLVFPFSKFDVFFDEKKIEVKEKELEDLRELRFDPEYYHDVKKMDALDAQIDDVHNEIEHLMEQWEEYSELMG